MHIVDLIACREVFHLHSYWQLALIAALLLSRLNTHGQEQLKRSRSTWTGADGSTNIAIKKGLSKETIKKDISKEPTLKLARNPSRRALARWCLNLRCVCTVGSSILLQSQEFLPYEFTHMLVAT